MMTAISVEDMEFKWENIPMELWTIILCFLPVKTLLVMRAVNKVFLALIKSDSLASSYLLYNNTASARSTNMVISLRTNYCYRKAHYDDFLCTPVECIIGKRNYLDMMTMPVGGVFQTKVIRGRLSAFPNVAGCVNGLVLLRQDEFIGCRNNKMVATLWNPSIRKSRPIALPKSRCHLIDLGLGYDPSTNDYKVLAMAQRSGQVWVYSVLKTRLWSKVFNSGMSILDPFPALTYRLLSFKGSLFWIETGGLPEPTFRLARFDFRTQRFSYSPMPPYYDTDPYSERRLATFDDLCLAVPVASDVAIGGIDIWIMDDVDKMSWTRRYVFPYGAPALGILHFKYWIQDCQFCSYSNDKCDDLTCKDETVGVYVQSLLLLN